MNALLLVSSPLQLLCAITLLNNLNISNFYVYFFVRKTNLMCLDHMQNLFELYGFNSRGSRIIFLPSNASLCLLVVLLNVAFFRFLNIFSCPLLIFGDFYNVHFHASRLLFSPSHTFVVDDGFSSFRALRDFIVDDIFFPSSKDSYKLNPFSFLLSKKPFHFFSLYTKYFSLSPLRTQCNLLPPPHTSQVRSTNRLLCYFIGTKLSERGAISLDSEIRLMRNILIYYERMSIKCIYIAKRTTSHLKLSKLHEMGYDIRIPHLPLEYDMFALGELPAIVSGFGSSLFCSLHSLFPSLEYHSFNIRPYLLNRNDMIAADHFLEYTNVSSHVLVKEIPIS